MEFSSDLPLARYHLLPSSRGTGAGSNEDHFHSCKSGTPVSLYVYIVGRGHLRSRCREDFDFPCFCEQGKCKREDGGEDDRQPNPQKHPMYEIQGKNGYGGKQRRQHGSYGAAHLLYMGFIVMLDVGSSEWGHSWLADLVAKLILRIAFGLLRHTFRRCPQMR